MKEEGVGKVVVKQEIASPRERGTGEGETSEQTTFEPGAYAGSEGKQRKPHGSLVADRPPRERRRAGTMITGSVLDRLNQAFAEGHDEPRLRQQLDAAIQSLWISLPRDPVLTKRVRALVPENCERLRWDDAEVLVDAIEHLVEVEKLNLHDEVIALRVTIARLGGVHSAMRIGRLVVAELQKRRKTGNPHAL
jgi:hypothetical protein